MHENKKKTRNLKLVQMSFLAFLLTWEENLEDHLLKNQIPYKSIFLLNTLKQT